ncbi:MAG: TonB-dependent receptor [Candidatus Omnitrophica bacterium]|nr:TonB-dependent receptor [Candidatus Omnitrophota bacterium]
MRKKGYFLSLVFLSLIFSLPAEVKAEAIKSTNYAIDLGELTVTASKIEQAYRHSTQNISIIPNNELSSMGAIEVSEVLNLLPSVDVVEYGTYGAVRSLRTRGTYPQQTLTLIDGRPINTPRDGLTDFNQVPLSNIERIEVVRGPASTIYGANAVGGIVNIITKTGQDKMHTEVLSKFGSFSTKQTSLSHGNKIGKLNYFLAYDYLASHGHRDNHDYLSHNANTKLGYQINENNHLTVSSGYFKSKAGSPGPLNFPDLDNRLDTFKKYIDLTYRGKFVEEQDLYIKLFHNIDRMEFVWTPDPINKDAHQTKIYGADAQISHTFFDIFRTAAGASFQEHRLNSSLSGKPSYNLKGAYLESETDFWGNGSLKFGLRWDDYSNFGDRLNPSASLNFWLFDKIKLHALAAKSFRAPTFNDLYWPVEDWGLPALWWPFFGRGAQGNLDIGPEKATSFEAGISGYFFDKFKTDLTFFKTEFKDLIEWVLNPNTFWWTPDNVSSAKIQGAEFETEFALVEHLKANLNYAYLEATDKQTGKWLIYRPRHLYKLKVFYSPTKNYEVGITTIYKTKRFTDTNNTVNLPSACTVNFSFNYLLNESITFLFEVKNLFDRQYQEQQGYPMPGRAFYAGAKISF